jgi:hypothetical protein
VRGLPVRDEPGPDGVRRFPVSDQLGLAAYITAIALYVLVGVLAIIGGTATARAEAVLLIVLMFLGFNAAWLLLFDDGHRARARAADTSPPSAQAVSD